MTRRLLIGLMAAAALMSAEPGKRIVSLSPNMTEILYGIGAFGQVVGVSEYCTWPPEVKKLPVLGGWLNPNLEKIAGLHPDVVIMSEGQATFVADKFRDLGLRVLTTRDQSVEEVYAAMMSLGRATGHEKEAERLVATTREGLARVAKKTAGLPKVRVLMNVDRTPGTLRDLTMATAGSIYSDLVPIAGGELVGARAKEGYAKLSKEDLLALNPEAILDFVHGAKSGDPLEAWRDMPELRAVRNHRVYAVNEDYVPHASQRIVLTVELFARLLHPEAK
jgi:iron complex transport system substrate-binding protein